ncbi:Glyoxylase, beta-lactamase superfamily II [Streptomyces sp. 1222.5]|uniref:hypothetical protein n=1 Tax=unclassified Streptomyces TaxID=2593676 RepID=UPI00089B651C|nr:MULTISPECIES: hypothetical protein [unclassified Streptomyces]PKW05227.1 glyoxylase-like metal-dependent hydrolase (beta-lactamase superfamily II) [Streptomyces sp. 5112.2]SED46571.1 Glyoxylase, beta-lactamase superfamily II [Streptomyces sp. 1222.5]
MGFADEHLIPLVDEGAGNSACPVDLGDGRALAVDAARDLRTLREAAEARGLPVAFAADTHPHADFRTGALQFAADDGASALASATGRRTFPHTTLGDGDEVGLGGLTLRAPSTPGHTDEHLAFLLLDGGSELGVFSGGSLIVGPAARTDLQGADRAEELARAPYRSLRRPTELPDTTAVRPTHGAGSFRSAPPGAERTPTIRAVGGYRLWRDGGFAVGALRVGALADAYGLIGAVWAVATLSAAAGVVVAVRMYATHPRPGTP